MDAAAANQDPLPLQIHIPMPLQIQNPMPLEIQDQDPLLIQDQALQIQDQDLDEDLLLLLNKYPGPPPALTREALQAFYQIPIKEAIACFRKHDLQLKNVFAPDEYYTLFKQVAKKIAPQEPGSIPNQAPATNYGMDGTSKSFTSDIEFEERLQAVKRSALAQKKSEEKNVYGTIDYDAPVTSEPNKIGLGTKIGVGVAVVVFGLVFALGDFIPSGSVSSSKDAIIEKNTLSPEEKETLQTRLQQYEATLSISPDDLVAREGVAVTLTELGDYTQAASKLEDLTKIKPSDPEVFRLLGEVKFEMKDYDGSASAYKSSAKISNKMDFQVLRGLTNALLAAKKPDEAVKILLATRDSLEREKSNQENIGSDKSQIDTQSELDPIQVELLLGKAYSDWGHVSDAVSVYDQLISGHPSDFRGYLAKGIILKANGKFGDAERMFIQARFFAPEGAKVIVDRYSRQ